MKLIDKISVFLPAYNEEKMLAQTTRKVNEILQKIAGDYEIIIINDGSKDKTGQIADKLASQNKKIKVVHHHPNRGYGAAVKSGTYAARYPWIVLFDSDGQFDFQEITKLLKKQKETNADIVWGYVLDRKVPLTRKINTLLWRTVVMLVFGLRVKWIDCGFRLFRKEVVQKIPKLESERGAFISSEFLIKAKKAGFKIVQVMVHHYPDIGGGSTGADLKVIIKSFGDLFKLWKKLR
ncbi:glycosyltransferase family 2 protein [Candidatus Shapirobacteria bacterium]|nr:glycosyltransferase family 2 protein [Candidatus Shapirobacteria bacterium]